MNNKLAIAAMALIAYAGIGHSAGAPDIFVPTYEVEGRTANVIQGLSNNGKYGVSYISPSDEYFSYTIGAVLYDFTGSSPVVTNLTQDYAAAGASDVTDDGKMVAGSVNNKPAICVYSNGQWKWETLPVPSKSYTVNMEDMQGNVSKQTFKLNGGQVNAVTPDGRYAVGLARCNDNEMIEYAVMWDLKDKSIIDVSSPRTGSDGLDEHQSRYMQLSNDGRYILCWNSFSFEGSYIFVYDREKNEVIDIDRTRNADGSFSPRLEGYRGIELDGSSKSMTSDGRYLVGSIEGPDGIYAFRFEIPTRELVVYNDGINLDVAGWGVTKKGLTLAATPAVTPYADALVCYNGFLYPMSLVYDGVYNIGMEARYGIDNTGKPTQVSDDGRTIVFITSKNTCYVARFKEDLEDALSNVDLMSNWTVTPRAGTPMTAFSSVSITFDYPIEADASMYSQVKLLDSDGKQVAAASSAGGVLAENSKLTVNFRTVQLEAGKEYTLSVPAGLCWIKGRKQDANKAIEVKFTGRANVPVKVNAISPESGASLGSLDVNDNPVEVIFDVPVKINGTADNRPLAHLYVDGSDESAASLLMDIDLNTNHLIIYPPTTVYLYKGSEYTVKVPAGAVCDLSGQGASEAFEFSYKGSYVPQLGDEKYVFRSDCNDFMNFLVYDGDHGVPVDAYASLGFTVDSTPWWYIMDEGDTTENMAFGSHSCYKDGRQADDWLVVRQLNIPKNVTSYLSFQSQSYRHSATDRLKVYVYEDHSSYNHLTAAIVKKMKEEGDLVFDEVLSPGASEELLAGEWTDNVVSLEKYKGKDIYICFHNDNTNQSLVMVDNIEVVKEVKAFLTITSASTVVNQESVPVKGILTVASDLADYSSLTMTLLDSEGKEISSISESGLSLVKDEIYNFEFPDQLPLLAGQENNYTIEYTLDDDKMDHTGKILNLAFEPMKRVVIEECTGNTCQNCPLGLLGMENLENRYGEQVIPIALHAYNNDPKGIMMRDYAAIVFNNDFKAPNGRINRRPDTHAPMYSDAQERYHFTAADVTGASPVWQDIVAEELLQPSYLDVELVANSTAQAGVLSYTANVKSALNVEDQNIRVLGVLMEDGLRDRQVSNLFTSSDETLGKFGRGGEFGQSSFWYTFDNVAIGYWGQSPNGTARLIPSSLEIGKVYPVNIEISVPYINKNPENLKMAVVLLDESTGRVINAAVSRANISGVEEIVDEVSGSLDMIKAGKEITVAGAGEIAVAVYGLDGRMIRQAYGDSTVTLNLDGYSGVVIVRASSAGRNFSKKVIL